MSQSSSLFEQFSGSVLLVLASVLLTAVLKFFRAKNTTSNKINGEVAIEPPTPFKLPIIGHLHLLSGYDLPYQAFTDLGKKYGSVVKLHLGNIKCVVVNEKANIREVLVTKGHHFDARPNFERYRQLFCGNKENSLAFCDWSITQKLRRDMLKVYTFPRAFTNNFNNLELLISEATQSIISKISGNQAESIEIKPIILRNCANIFTRHFCSKDFLPNENQEFLEMIDCFDDIFYEVNRGYLADFLPILLTFHRKNLNRMNGLAQKIRKFVLKHIIDGRFETIDQEDTPDDYVDSLIQYIKKGNSDFTWDTALFALEDIIGGHSAVGNFLVKILAFLSVEPEVQQKIQNEIDLIMGEPPNFRKVNISDRTLMPYTEAAIFEAIRLIASPIVPRVASQNSSINGYKIEKDTVIFLNNYDLSMSNDLWEEPTKFKPERFMKNGCLVKPDHFLPFGGGRRSCIGYKMVQLVSFGVLSGVLQEFSLFPSGEGFDVEIGSLALPKDTFRFKFVKREMGVSRCS